MRGKIIPYSADELAYIEANCTIDRKELVQQFNAKFGRSLTLDNINGLCKRKHWSTGRDGRFKKGHVPHPNAKPKGPNKTSFKKNNRPSNIAKVGDEVKRTKDGYIKVKVAEPNKWRMKHHLIWEEANGLIAKGIIIQFLDGNPDNCALDNLEAITRADQAPLNKAGYSRLPAEVKPTFKAVVKLQRTIRAREQA